MEPRRPVRLLGILLAMATTASSATSTSIFSSLRANVVDRPTNDRPSSATVLHAVDTMQPPVRTALTLDGKARNIFLRNRRGGASRLRTVRPMTIRRPGADTTTRRRGMMTQRSKTSTIESSSKSTKRKCPKSSGSKHCEVSSNSQSAKSKPNLSKIGSKSVASKSLSKGKGGKGSKRGFPSLHPSLTPTLLPSYRPSFRPTSAPSRVPSIDPTAQPSTASDQPTSIPTATSSIRPSIGPTNFPTTPSPTSGIILYQNDFESPLEPPRNTPGFCSILDDRDVNQLHGSPDNPFAQEFTVETVIIDSVFSPTSGERYRDPQSIGGEFAIGFLSEIEDDRLGLAFDTQGKPFLNVCMDVAPVELPLVATCVSSDYVDARFEISLIDSPLSTAAQLFGTILDSAIVEAPAGANGRVYMWTSTGVSLDTTGATNGMVTIVWDAVGPSTYSVIDNIVVVASNSPSPDCAVD